MPAHTAYCVCRDTQSFSSLAVKLTCLVVWLNQLPTQLPQLFRKVSKHRPVGDRQLLCAIGANVASPLKLNAAAPTSLHQIPSQVGPIVNSVANGTTSPKIRRPLASISC